MNTGALLDKAAKPPDATDFPHSTATEVGRAENKALVDYAIARGWCSPRCEYKPDLPRVAKAVDPRKPRGAYLAEGLAEAGAKLAEPFGRAALAAAAGLDERTASNVMTAWRHHGWIVGGNGKWVRTSGFGKLDDATV